MLSRVGRGREAFAFSSGCSSTFIISQLLNPGDHIVCEKDLYGGSLRIFEKILKPKGISVDAVDLSSLDNLKKALKKETKLLWIESPTNPLLKVLDIKALCSFAKANQIISVVDNTFLSPFFQSPFSLGADVVVHSCTKYIGGHSDVLAGALILKKDSNLTEKIRFLSKSIGAVCSPLDCYLLIRSLKTLAYRMKGHAENALKVAEFLESHKSVEQVLYPGLKSHPQYSLSQKQTNGSGGMLSFFY